MAKAKAKAGKGRRQARKREAVKEPPKQELRVAVHVHVPKHEVLSPEEVEKLVHHYHASLTQFPYILTSDPVVKEIGAKPGDVIRITRRSGTAGMSTYYRLVVEG